MATSARPMQITTRGSAVWPVGWWGLGVVPGDVVATLIPNVPAQVEAHFGVPACGAVLNTINIRLDVDTVSYIFDHGGATVALVDTQFLSLAEAAVEAMEGAGPAIIEVPDEAAGFPATGRYQTYEDLLAGGDPAFDWIIPTDEWESLALNYTSGTTGRPQGRRLPPSRGLPDDDGHRDLVADGSTPAFPNHRAAVSLQRLEPLLDDAGAGRDGRVCCPRCLGGRDL